MSATSGLSEPIICNFELNVTYRCNLRCDLCNRFVGILPVPNGDVTPDQLSQAAVLLKESGIRPKRIKIAGGEPLVHPRIDELCKVLVEEWKPTRFAVLASNGTVKHDTIPGIHYRYSPPRRKYHLPSSISPSDLGIPFTGLGVSKPCSTQSRCGRTFDAFGFSFCSLAGIMGRVLGVNPYSDKPVMWGTEDICKHCIYSLPRPLYLDVSNQAMVGKIVWPTTTYKEGLERNRRIPMQFKRFGE